MGNINYEKILENISDGFIALNNQMVVTYFNKQAEVILGKRATDVMGKHLFDTFPEACGTIFDAEYRGAIKDKKPRFFEAYYNHPPANWYEVRVYPGDEGISVYFHVINERKELQEKLLQNEIQIKDQLEEYTSMNEELIQINEELSTLMEELTDKNHNVQSLIDAIPDHILVFNYAGTIISGNISQPDALFPTFEKFDQRSIPEAFPSEIALIFSEKLAEFKKSGAKKKFGFSYTTQNKRRYYETRLIPYESSKVLSIISDATERKEQQQALERSEKRFRSVIESSPNGIYIYELNENKELVLVTANQAADDIIGISHKALVGKTLNEAFPNLAGTNVPALYQRVALGEEDSGTFDIPYTDHQISGHYRVKVYSTGNGSIVVDFYDIADSLTIQQKLEAAENKYRALVENSQGLIFNVTPEGVFTFVSQSMQTLLGYTRAETEGFHFSKFIYQHDLERCDTFFTEALQDKRPSSAIEYRVIHKDNSVKWHRTVISPVLNESGNIVSVVGNTIDITASKMAEIALRENEERLRSLFENATVGIYRTSTKGKILMANASLVKMLGYESLEELQKRDLEKEGYDTDYPRNNFQEMIERDGFVRGLESAWEKTDGSTIYLIENAWVVKDEQGKTLYYEGIVEDITMQKKALSELKKSEEKYRLIFDKSPVGVAHYNHRGLITECNQYIANILGIPRMSCSGYDLLSTGNPGITRSLKEAFDGKTTIYDGLFFTDNSPVAKPVRALFTPIFSSGNKLEGGILILEDRTLNAEKEELERQAAIARESVKFKQNFLANMSHEIRTPLTGVIGMVEILSNTDLDPEQKEYLNILKNSGENLIEIINQVLDFSKIEAGKVKLSPKIFEFKKLINNSRSLFGGICSFKGLQFRTVIDEKIPDLLKADNVRIAQIINNLVSNAVKFTDTGSITLKSSLLEYDKNIGNLKIRIDIIDTGIGIKPEKQRILFTPFSQIEENDTRHYEGSGLGLSICKELAALMDGEIGLKSEPLNGSNFWFTFRATEAKNLSPEEFVRTKNTFGIQKKRLRILLVEDKLINQKVIKLILLGLGHHVTIASNGNEALAAYKPHTFDLILMDIQMPVMDGITATQKLKETHKLLPPVVGLSANAFEGDREKYMNSGMDEYLTKPIKTSDFEELMNRLF